MAKVLLRDGRPVYSGEAPCEGVYANGTQCAQGAKYAMPDGSVRCGTHSAKDKARRRDLIKNPRAQEHRDAIIAIRYETAAAEARKRLADNNLWPCVITAGGIGMGKEGLFVPLEGYLPVFPNHRHGHAFNYCSGDNSWLSPMRLGPVRHGQPGVSPAASVENYHQFNKVFPEELSDQPCECIRAAEWKHMAPLPAFYRTRDTGYADETPRRHKVRYIEDADSRGGDEGKKKKRSRGPETKNLKGIPLYSLHAGLDGRERHYTYVESRYFYCTHLAELIYGGGYSSNAMRGLMNRIRQGFKLQIVGYDAYPPDATDKESLYRHYCDPARPFGHEMVILTLLVAEWDQWDPTRDLPWNRYRREHPEIY